MRSIKLTHAQFREWRLNTLSGPEKELGDRDRIKKELLERNGGLSFRLMSPMGRFIGTVRGENNSAAVGGFSQNGAPSPESCICKAYAGTPAGKHHPVCQHRAAWEAGQQPVTTLAVPPPNLNPAMNVVTQKVMPPIDNTPRVQHMQVPKQVSPHQVPISVTNKPVASQALPAAPTQPVATVQVPAVVALIPPEQCDCRHFAKPSGSDPKQHHFVCEHFEKWKIAHPTPEQCTEQMPKALATEGHHFENNRCTWCNLIQGETTLVSDTEKPPPPPVDFVLVDLDTQNILRDATSDEVTRAHEHEAKHGAPLVTLDDGVFAVVERPAPQVAAS